MMSNLQNNRLIELRQQIDVIDQKLVTLIGQRMALVEKVGLYKKDNHIAPLDPVRWQQVIEAKRLMAKKCNLNPDFIEAIFDLLHEEALMMEKAV